MKIRRIGFLGMLLAVMVVFLSGCATLPGQPSLSEQQAQAQKLADAVTGFQSTLVQTKAEVAAVKAMAVAATQPVVVTPATPTAPAVTVMPADTVVKAAESVNAAADKINSQLTTVAKVADGLANAATKYQSDLATAATQPDPKLATMQAQINAISTVAQPFVPAQYQPLVLLGTGLATGLLGFLAQKSKTTAANTAINSAVAGVQSALINGSMTASPAAAATVDAVVVSHPATDVLVDSIAAAAKK